jgi:hypothetical protein
MMLAIQYFVYFKSLRIYISEYFDGSGFRPGAYEVLVRWSSFLEWRSLLRLR